MLVEVVGDQSRPYVSVLALPLAGLFGDKRLMVYGPTTVLICPSERCFAWSFVVSGRLYMNLSAPLCAGYWLRVSYIR